jgi:hypothetical protein
VALLVANAAAGLPQLGNGDYASGLASGDMSWAGPWTVLPTAYQDIATTYPLEQRRPLVASWPNLSFSSLHLPSTSDHFCLAAFVTTPDDNSRSVSNASVDYLAMHDPHVGQRNLHIVTTPGAGEIHRFPWPRTIVIDFWNSDEDERTVDLTFVPQGFVGQLAIAMSTINEGVGARTSGLAETGSEHLSTSMGEHWYLWSSEVSQVLEDRESRLQLVEGHVLGQRAAEELLRSRIAQIEHLDRTRLWTTAASWRSSQAAFHDVRIPGRDRVVAAITFLPEELVAGRPATLHVIQRTQAAIVGGSTFLIMEGKAQGR